MRNDYVEYTCNAIIHWLTISIEVGVIMYELPILLLCCSSPLLDRTNLVCFKIKDKNLIFNPDKDLK